MKRPSQDKLDEAVAQVVTLYQRARQPVALVGGIAMQLYGSDRLTYDVDVIAHGLPPGHIGSSGSPLTIGGVHTVAPNGVPLDVIVRRDEYQALYVEALSHGHGHIVDGLPVVRAEHLAAMKMAAMRKKDELDLDFLIQNDVLNLKATKAIIDRHLGIHAGHEFVEHVETARWLKSRGR